MTKNDSYSATWQSPSNIALVKYWGKKGFQLPANASISFTLDTSHTITTLRCQPKSAEEQDISVFMDGKEKDSFLPKIKSFFGIVSKIYPELTAFDFRIETTNTFPHSSGIASSASGFSALSLCLISILDKLGANVSDPFQVASHLARIGSGSACRSVYGGIVMWGQHPDYAKSSDEHGIQVTDYHPVFETYQDTILLVHKGQKSVSSTVGHNLLNGHPFGQSRYEIAQRNMTKIQSILNSGDLDRFVEIVENEALMLHALMMTSNPSFVLMKPETLGIIHAIRDSRLTRKHHICFTLDAGANVHMLYPKKDEKIANELIENELVSYCENGAYIRDNVGDGPKNLNA